MAKASKQQAIKAKRRLVRFEVVGLESDRNLIRSIARDLAVGGPQSAQLRSALSKAMERELPQRGGILAALRRSPCVGLDLNLSRPRESGRKLEF